MHPQLVLSLDAPPAATFGSFHADEPRRVVPLGIEAFAEGRLDERQIYLWGEAGSGKSHLLVAACHAVREAGYLAAYVPGSNANHGDALAGYEGFELLCIDDLQRLEPGSERELYRCINRCHEQGTRLLFAADRPIDALGLEMTDLVSRLTWGPTFQLAALQGPVLLEAVRAELERRSLVCGEDLPAWLVRRFGNDLAAIKRFVGRLGETSLRERKRATVALARRLDGDEGGAPGG